MSDPSQPNITSLLGAWTDGQAGSFEQLLPLVYEELRKLARHHLRSERKDHTLQPTALAHEAFLRLLAQHRVQLHHRGQFFGLAAQAMRRILVDHARAKAAAKRGGPLPQVSLDDVGDVCGIVLDADLVALDDSLVALARVDPRKATIVELRFFGGFSIAETAEVLAVSDNTINREWRMAKAWLYQNLNRTAQETPADADQPQNKTATETDGSTETDDSDETPLAADPSNVGMRH